MKKIKLTKIFFSVSLFVFIFFGLINTNIKNKENIENINKRELNQKINENDLLFPGEIKHFYGPVYEISNSYKLSFDYIDNVDDGTNITYNFKFDMWNMFNSSSGYNYYISSVEILFYEIDNSGSLLYNGSKEYNVGNLNYNEIYYSDVDSFTVSKDKNIAVKVLADFNGGAFPSDSSRIAYLSKLSTLDIPNIQNINIDENYDLNEYILSYDLFGKKDLINEISFSNSSLMINLVEGIDYEILEYDTVNTSIPTKIKFLNLNPNTIYNNLKINLKYEEAFFGGSKVVEYVVPTFGTKPENLENAISIESSNPTENSIDLNLNVNLSGMETVNLTNITINDGTEIIKSYDVNLSNEVLNISTTISSLNKNTTYNWDVDLTYKTTLNNTYNFNFALDEFTTTPEKPEIINFDAIDIGVNSVKLIWEIIDNDSSINEVKIYDMNNPTHVIYSGNEILETGFEINNLIESTVYHYGMKLYWKDINGKNLEPITTEIYFATNPTPPSIILDNSFISIGEESVNLNWEFLDSNNILNKVEIIDNETSNILFEDSDGSNGFNNSIEILDLESNKIYNYQIKYYWSYNHPISGDLITDQNNLNFSFSTKSYVPIINDFSLVNKNETYLTVAWDVTDQSNVVESIEIIDKSNSNNVVFSTNQLVSEYKIQNLNPGQEYNYELKVNWNSLNLEQNTSSILANLNAKTIDNSPNIEEISFEKDSGGMMVYWNIIDSNDIEIQSINIYVNDEMFFNTNELNGSLYISNEDLNNIKNGNIKVSVNYIDYFGVQKSVENEIKYDLRSNSNKNTSWLWFAEMILIFIILGLVIYYLYNTSIKEEENQKEKI